MLNPRRWFLLSAILAAVCVVVQHGSLVVSSQSPPSKVGGAKKLPQPQSQLQDQQAVGFPNFDIRNGSANVKTSAKAGDASSNQLTLEPLKPRAALAQQVGTGTRLQQTMRAAQESLAARVPNLEVDYNQTVRVLEIVGVTGIGSLAPARADVSNEQTLRGFLSENAALYGITTQQVGQLAKVSDYTNPSGNLSFVEFQQQVNDIPVFQGYVRGIISPDGRLVRTTGLLAPGVNADALATTPTCDATQAIADAAATIHIGIEPDTLSVLDRPDEGRATLVSQGPFDQNV